MLIIAGPCVIESEKMTLSIAESLKEIALSLDIDLIFKASVKKANRTSNTSFTGLGYSKGIEILQKVKDELSLKVITDFHEYSPMEELAEVVDYIQTPAFLVRQSEYLSKIAQLGKPVNMKKGQFLSPGEMLEAAKKLGELGCKEIMICERGNSFGYNYLINDFRGVSELLESEYPVIFDATHSVQRPGGLGKKSGGDSRFAPNLAYAASIIGCQGIFTETHPNPHEALSDGPNMIPLDKMKNVLNNIKKIRELHLELQT